MACNMRETQTNATKRHRDLEVICYHCLTMPKLTNTTGLQNIFSDIRDDQENHDK